jgi:teichuronic acid biosynthesis glycosyltransferase TuaC
MTLPSPQPATLPSLPAPACDSPERRLGAGLSRSDHASRQNAGAPARGLKNVVVVCQGYPNKAQPDNSPFVHQFAVALARQGHHCSVICPTSWLERRYGVLPAREEMEQTENAPIQVLRPRYLSFSARQIGPYNTARLTYGCSGAAALRTIQTLTPKPDVVYGHFLYPSGRAAVLAGAQLGCAGVVGVGEGTFWTVKPVGFDRARRDFAAATGMIAVSSVIRQELIRKLRLPPDRVPVFPNGVDLNLFHPRGRSAMCRKYGLREDRFNIVFVGDFGHDKGVRRLMAAARGLPNVALILAGRGRLPEPSAEVVFQQPVPHRAIPELLGAADLFVLPTTIEGSCNAVIEAMACGLPVVTSNGPCMDDLLTEEVALRVDPLDVAALRNAIQKLMANPILRVAMTAASPKRARLFDINVRARGIMEWITNR